MSFDEEGADVSAVFSSAMIDKRRKKRITVRLQDSDGEDVDMKETVTKLNDWIHDRLKSTDEKGNRTANEIFPLITQLMCEGMVSSMGGSRMASAFVLSQDHFKYGMINQMMLSFYFLKFVQENKLTIIADEEDITDEEIEKYERINKASGIATLGALMGLEPKELISHLLKSGAITKEDLKGQGFDMEDIENATINKSDKNPQDN